MFWPGWFGAASANAASPAIRRGPGYGTAGFSAIDPIACTSVYCLVDPSLRASLDGRSNSGSCDRHGGFHRRDHGLLSCRRCSERFTGHTRGQRRAQENAGLSANENNDPAYRNFYGGPRFNAFTCKLGAFAVFGKRADRSFDGHICGADACRRQYTSRSLYPVVAGYPRPV